MPRSRKLLDLLVVQETDWLQRGPHQQHHILERLSERGHQIVVVDFEILYNPELMVTVKLKLGEGLLFNNQCVLHGKNEFNFELPERSVLTSSVDLDDFYSTMRILRRTLDTEDSSMAFNQGMVV